MSKESTVSPRNEEDANAKAVSKAVLDYQSKRSTQHSLRAYRECNQVAQENIFRERVRREMRDAAQWHERWSFMTSVDPHGRPRTAPERPTKWEFFDGRESPPVPLTSQGDIGSRLRKPSPAVKGMQRFEQYMRRPRLQTDVGKVNFS